MLSIGLSQFQVVLSLSHRELLPDQNGSGHKRHSYPIGTESSKQSQLANNMDLSISKSWEEIPQAETKKSCHE